MNLGKTAKNKKNPLVDQLFKIRISSFLIRGMIKSGDLNISTAKSQVKLQPDAGK